MNNEFVSVPLRLNEQQSRDVQRFYDTCEDGQGYDVSKDRMKALARIGLVRSLGFGRYELTDVGAAAVNGLRDKVDQPAAQHQGEPVEAIPLKDCVPGWHSDYNDGLFATADAVVTLYLHPPASDGFSAGDMADQGAKAFAARDGEVERLRAALKFYADREHYHFESGNWDTVSGEPLNILWCGDDPDLIEDGTVARNALSASAEPKPFTTPDCPDCACVQDGQCLCTTSKPSAEPSAPVERDELKPCPFCGCQVTFLTGREDYRILGKHGRACPFVDTDVVVDSWEAWQARAALERKS